MELARVIMINGLALLLVISIYDFNSTYFNKVYRWNKYIPRVLLCIYFLIGIITYPLNITGVTNLASTLCFLVLISFSYQGSISSHIVGVLFLIPILVGGELLTHFVYSHFSKESVAQLLENELAKDYLFVMSRFLIFILIKILKFYFVIKNNRLKDAKVKFTEWVLFILIPLFTVFLMCILFEVATYMEAKNSVYVSMALLLIILMNVVFYMLYFKTIELTEYSMNEIMYEKQLEIYNEQYSRLKESLKDYEILKHDFKNSIISFWSDIAISDTMLSKDELLKQFNTFIEEACPKQYTCYTKNVAIDMILNAKVNKAKKSSINIDMKYPMNLNVTVENKIICVVLGNALDNAIEACEKFHKDTIKIKLMNQKNNLYIEIINGYEGKIKIVNGFPITQKEDKRNHGYGLRSIYKLVEENDGLLNMNINNGIFTLQLYFAQN
ncbi:MAG: GHKL domain-containing protein [Eubacteriales bacterium]